MDSQLKLKLEDAIRPFNEDPRLRHKFKIDLLQRLLKKIEKVEDAELDADLELVYQQIPQLQTDYQSHKPYHQALKRAQLRTKRKYAYVLRGSLKHKDLGSYVAAGLAVGLALESAFEESFESSFIAIGTGILITLCIGYFVGDYNEKKAEREGLTY